QHREVGARIGADHARLELTLVVQLDGDLVRVVDHVRVGQHVAVGADDEPRAERTLLEEPRPRLLRRGRRARAGALLWALVRAGLLARDEAAEEVVERVVFVDSRNLRARGAAALA